MIDKNKNKNKGSGEFDDDSFEDFSDADFDEASFDEGEDFVDLPAEEGELEGDDFEAEDWGDAEDATDKKGKKKKSGGGLGFNAIVIIGAVILGGGVLAFNIMRESGKAAEARPSVFQSILNIGDVLDGSLLGDKPEDDAAAQQAEAEQQEQGFLNNPDVPVPPTPVQQPPAPTPIAPADETAATNEPLTPMPLPTAAPSTEPPRGPEDAVPPTAENVPSATDIAEMPSVPSPVTEEPSVPAPDAPAAAPSAEDILKQAMANREQKQQTEDNAGPASPDGQKSGETLPEKMADAKEEAKDVIADVKEEAKEKVEDIKEAVTPESAPQPEPSSPVAQTPAATPEQVAANNEAVAALEGKLDSLLKRMDQIESDLGSMKSGKGADTQEIEQTVAALKEDIAEIKSRPAATTMQETEEAPKPAPKKKKKAAPKPTVSEDEAYSPAPATSPAAATASKKPASAVASGKWELRAAQPGRAWVSKPGDRDMQAVAVGETLAGIGRITAITYQNGRWTVMGTQGVVQQ